MGINPETQNYQSELDTVQVAIEGINHRIALLQIQRAYYEQRGHEVVALMMEATINGNGGQ